MYISDETYINAHTVVSCESIVNLPPRDSSLSFESSLATLCRFASRSQLLLSSVETREAIKIDNTYAGHYSKVHSEQFQTWS